MDFRQGTCTQCKHSFRVKATSTAQKAKCPKCGGVVEIGAVQHAETPPAPAGRAAAGSASTLTSGAHPKHHGRHEHKKKSNDMPKIIGGVIAVIVVVVILVVALGGGDKGTAAHAGNAPQAEAATADHLPDAARLAETTEEEWTEMNALAADYFKPGPFDRKRERSGDLLIHRGKKAVPVVLNGWKRLDISTPEGTDTGWKAQTLLLSAMCNGTNFGWIRDTRPEDIAYNHKVMERWFEAYKEAGGDSEKWTEISKRGALPASQ